MRSSRFLNTMIINHSDKTIDEICTHEGRALWGERLIFERILNDCEKDENVWHIFYDIHLPLSINRKTDIQIDFFLLCSKGGIIIEVKGGELEIIDGKFINHGAGRQRVLKESPFTQVDSYKWAMINNHFLNKDEIFLTTMCAFPSATLEHTSNNDSLDLCERMWNKFHHEDSSKSFAKFCMDLLQSDQRRKRWTKNEFTEKELNGIIAKFAPTIKLSRSYAERSLSEILDWLKADNIEVLESLSKNLRIIIEGGPGTGKTTIAKAYIDKFSTQRGLYICWNQLLASKIKFLLKRRNLTNCDVERIESFLIKISGGKITHEAINRRNISLELIREMLYKYKSSPLYPNYSYIIIDEIHDMLDIGAIDILDCLSSIDNNGLKTGRFLVFYDEKQGYDNQSRGLNNLISVISDYSTIFILNNNKRVPTNSDILKIANKIRNLDTFKELKKVLDSDIISNEHIRVNYYPSPHKMMEAISEIAKTICNKQHCNQYVLLTHSNLNKTKFTPTFSFSELLKTMRFTIQELDESNINEQTLDKLPWTSILRYKGLEKEHVILAVKCEDFFNCYELYIGLTRAILSVDILILE